MERIILALALLLVSSTGLAADFIPAEPIDGAPDWIVDHFRRTTSIRAANYESSVMLIESAKARHRLLMAKVKNRDDRAELQAAFDKQQADYIGEMEDARANVEWALPLMADLKINQIGALEEYATVEQILDETRLIARAVLFVPGGISERKAVVLIMPTDGLADGSKIEPCGPWHVMGTQRIGGATFFALERIDLKKWIKPN